MKRELCFNIESQDLYLEQVLVDYMNIPIFFLCMDEKQYYIALCTNVDELRYIVTKLSLSDVYDLLHGKIPMRDVILKQKEYWDIVSGDEICMDMITKKSIEVVDTSLLPEASACFKILTEQMQLFVYRFDNEFFSEKYFSKGNKKAAECNVENNSYSNAPLYDEKMYFLKTTEVAFRNFEKAKQREIGDLFIVVKSHGNCITVAA